MIPVIAATASCSADLPLQRGQAMDSTPPEHRGESSLLLGQGSGGRCTATEVDGS